MARQRDPHDAVPPTCTRCVCASAAGDAADDVPLLQFVHEKTPSSRT
eukprot:CAMPEP_0194483172 /NCGR_PEP_ID=MMETSP0253-20130528/4880_1 /TAXON_ID=2966 /ORGANISM="Noctiluca scintillans" /LENGTH=46 /DNA_ID= /DNA_START= /DNA_END= /DNA_ORIENTATION=